MNKLVTSIEIGMYQDKLADSNSVITAFFDLITWNWVTYTGIWFSVENVKVVLKAMCVQHSIATIMLYV